jgi:hypothetical protein
LFEYQKPTDAEHIIKIDSAITLTVWDRPMASPGDTVKIIVHTEFVSEGSAITIRIFDSSASNKLNEINGKINGNRCEKIYKIPDKGTGNCIYFEADLTKHGIKQKSKALDIILPIKIKNLKWDKAVVTRGDSVKFSADIDGAEDGTEATVEIYEYSKDGAHEFITRFPTFVRNRMVQGGWDFDYYHDTKDIPTSDENKNGYEPPRYFFRVRITKLYADSGLLEFKDWIEFSLTDEEGNPIPNQEYVLRLPDGNEKTGTLDVNGHAKQDNIPPGRSIVTFPNLKGYSFSADD